MAKVELEGKLTSGFPAMNATVQVHKQGPGIGNSNGLLRTSFVPRQFMGRTKH